MNSGGDDGYSSDNSVESEKIEVESIPAPEEDDENVEGEDLLATENLFADYQPIPELDKYEADGFILEDVTEDLTNDESVEVRRKAEAAMDARDRILFRREARSRGMKAVSSLEEDGRPPCRRRRVESLQDGDLPEEEDNGEILLAEHQQTGAPLKEWIIQDRVQHELSALFRRFLRNFRENEIPVYELRLRDLITYSRTSLMVDFMHLANFSRVLYQWTVLQPKPMIEVFNKVAYELVCQRQPNFDLLWSKEVYVRFENIPVEEKLRALTKASLDTLIYIKGVVTRRTGVFPQLKQVMYDCLRCGNLIGPFFINEDKEFKPDGCPNCNSKGPLAVNAQNTIYGNYQKLTLQESPSDVPSGMVPRQKEIILQQDLIDSARPGDEVMVCGVFTHSFDATLNKKCGFPVFRTTIEANNIIRRDNLSSVMQLTDTDRSEIVKLSKDPRIAERIFKSIAPSIHGHEYIKMAIALALFGGNEKRSGLHRMRGDINVLLLGDPGTGKSQFLKYVQKVCQRSVYNNGKGASAVGLTAAVQKDPVTREWTLEGGALVLADRGICLIDEFDKMNDQDRVSIHEAMEQQSISISKAGIVTQLQARCAVLAAANPIGGKYDVRLPFSQNVMLEDPIISRFDCLCVVRDLVEEENDARLARFIVGVHSGSHPGENALNDEVDAFEATLQSQDDPDIIPQDLLKKYIIYAKNCASGNLKTSNELGDGTDPMERRIVEVYNELRQESSHFEGVNITVRHLESIIRMAESHAKMHLRDQVLPQDIDMGVRMMVETFITTQKFSVQRSLRRRMQRHLNKGKNSEAVLLEMLDQLFKELIRDYRVKGQRVPTVLSLKITEVENKIKQTVPNFTRLINHSSIQRSHYIINTEANTISKKTNAS
eukprot:g530.t1